MANKKKPARIRQGANTAAQAVADQPQTQVLSGTLEILGNTLVVVDSKGVPLKTVDAKDYIPALGNMWIDIMQHASDPQKLAMLPVVTRQMDQAAAYTLGYKPSMALLAAPTNVDLLGDAVDNAVEEAGPISAVSGLAYDGIDIDQMKAERQQLGVLDKYHATAEQRVYTTEVLQSHLQNDLAGKTRQIYRSYNGAVGILPEGSLKLADTTRLANFVGGAAAQAGLDTKKLVNRVRTTTTNNVMEEMQQQGAGGQPPPAGTPGTAPGTPLSPAGVPPVAVAGGHGQAGGMNPPQQGPVPVPRTPKPRGQGKGSTKKRG